MLKLIGKIRQAIRARRHKKIPRWTHVPRYYGQLDHVKHYHAQGDTRYLCGTFYDRDTQTTGVNRPAVSSEDVSCNRCQRAHWRLMQTPEGRKRLGVDTYVGERLPA